MADIITAVKARELADRINELGRTPEELEIRYNQGLKEIQRAAETGYYGIPLIVGDIDKPEFQELMTTQGFRTFQNSSTPEGQRTVSVDPQGDLENIEINWSTFEFTQTQTTLQRPNSVTLFVKVAGYPLARPLYYSLTGTLINTDFVGNQDEGEIVFDPEGEGGININVKTGGSRVGLTVQALVYYDALRETLLHSYDEITVIV
jgi:hypothetical protein